MSAGLNCHSSRIPGTAKLTTLRFMPLPRKASPASIVIQAWNGRKVVPKPAVRGAGSVTGGKPPRASPGGRRPLAEAQDDSPASREALGAHQLFDRAQV